MCGKRKCGGGGGEEVRWKQKHKGIHLVVS